MFTVNKSGLTGMETVFLRAWLQSVCTRSAESASSKMKVRHQNRTLPKVVTLNKKAQMENCFADQGMVAKFM
jgi:hypothetical protein